MIEEFCRTCGKRGGDYREWYSSTRCLDCQRRTKKQRQTLDKSIWGYVCEDYVKGYSVKKLGIKYNVCAPAIKMIIYKYLGIGEDPIILSFVPREEVVANAIKFDHKPGDWVRVVKVGHKYNGRIKQVHKICPRSGGIQLKGSGNILFSKFHLEPYEMKEQKSFNI